MNHSDCFLSFSLLTHSNPTIRVACMVLVVAQPSASHKETHLGPRATSARDQRNRGLPRLRNVHQRDRRLLLTWGSAAVPTAAMQFNKITVRPLPCAIEITGAATVQSSKIAVRNRRAVQRVRSSFALSTLAAVQSSVQPIPPYRLRDVRCPPPSSLFALAYGHPLCPSCRAAAHREFETPPAAAILSGRRKHGRRRQGLDVLCMVILFHV
jgi:hypothetical protein